MQRFVLLLILFVALLSPGSAARSPISGRGSRPTDRLIQACKEGDPVRVLQLFQAYNHPVDQRDDDRGRTCLLWAAELGHLGLVQTLLADPWRACPLLPDSTGSSALHLAALRGHRSVVRALVRDAGLHPDTPRDNEGLTPLMRAASVGQLGE